MIENLGVTVATAKHNGESYVILKVEDTEVVLRPVDAANVAKALQHGVAIAVSKEPGND